MIFFIALAKISHSQIIIYDNEKLESVFHNAYVATHNCSILSYMPCLFPLYLCMHIFWIRLVCMRIILRRNVLFVYQMHNVTYTVSKTQCFYAYACAYEQNTMRRVFHTVSIYTVYMYIWFSWWKSRQIKPYR